ncbi:MAG: glycosyltransferase family 9 protein [Saprospiraceae bacterium]|nr:glycosyltransferase family 9 protein [Saprospiraceae bacterium]
MKILVLRFSSIGDIVLTTPVVRCLHEQSGAEVHFLCKKPFASLFEGNPHLHRCWTFEKDVNEVIKDLRKEKFDFIADLHHNLRSLRVKLALRRPSASFNKRNWEKWLLVNLHINRMPDEHIVQRYMATVKQLGVRYDGRGLDFFIRPENEVSPQDLPPHPFVAVVIGAAHATKRLTDPQITELCTSLKLPIVLLGGKEDAARGASIAEQAGPHVSNFCGKLNLQQSASVIKQAATVCTHDTGLMHMAAALNKNMVSVWGNTVPAFGMTPFYPEVSDAKHTLMEVKNLSCRPCSKIGYNVCPKGHFRCMVDQKNEDLLHAISDQTHRQK